MSNNYNREDVDFEVAGHLLGYSVSKFIQCGYKEKDIMQIMKQVLKETVKEFKLIKEKQDG